MLAQRGLTLQAIADRHGVTRECIRQVLNKLDIKPPLQRRREAKLYAESHNLTKHIPAGRNCIICEEYKFWRDFPISKQRKSGRDPRCKACLAAHNRHLYQNDIGGYKTRQLQWQRENKEKCAEHSRRWLAKNSGYQRERRRKRYAADPEFRERYLVVQRKYQRHRYAADPEYRAKRQAQAREGHRRRKQERASA